MTHSVADPVRTLWCADLIDRLRREGFDIGVGQCLQIERILDVAGRPAATQDLATLIGPIVSRDPDEQRRFYELFDEHIGAVTIEPETEVEEEPRPRRSVRTKTVELEPPPPIPWWRQRRVWAAAGSAAVLAALLMIPWGSQSAPPVQIPIDTVPPPADTLPRSGLADLVILTPRQAAIDAPVRGSMSRLPLRLAVTALPVLLFLGYEFRRRRRRHAVAERADEARAPYVWPIRIPNAAAALFPPADLAATARALRRRQRGTELAFAIEPTIRATIESFGFPAARFEAVTRPAEYLVLIERATPRDHQAHYFAALTQRLALEGAFVTQYFFEHDPRVCFQPGVLRGVRIADLLRQREGDRLLIFSDGYNFLHPVRGTPVPWIDLMDGWRERALITPVDPRRWGAREAVLKRHFSILPPTLDGLRCAADYFDTGIRPDLSRLKERDRSLPPPPDGPGVTAAELRSALADDGLFRWLCACAVYPELHWDLTARLGDLGEVGTHTLTERNVLRLVRLRWFRDGLMPNDFRRSLLDELARLDQGTGLDTEQAARQMLARLIEHEPVDLESVAGRLQHKELLQQRLYLYRADPPARRETLNTLRDEVAEEEILRDVTVVRLLERSVPNRLALALPRWIREAVWPAGHQALGARRGLAAGLAAALATGAWLALPDLRPGAVLVSPTVIVPALRAAVLQPGDRADLGLTLLDSAGAPIGLAGVTFATSEPGVVTVDTTSGKPILLAGQSGSAVVTVDRGGIGVRIPVRVRPDSGSVLLLAPGWFERGVLGRLLSPEVPPPPPPKAPSSNAPATRPPSSSAGGRTSWTSCDEAVVEIKTSTFGETWGVAQANRAGSAVVIGRAPGLTLVRVVHVTQGSSNPLVREIETPIDPLAPATLADMGPILTSKAAAMVELLRGDSALTIRGVGEVVSDPLGANQNVVQAASNDPRVLTVLESLVAQGVPRSRLDVTTREVPPVCGSVSLPAIPADGQLDRMNFIVVRGSANQASAGSLTVVPATLELAAGYERQLQVESGPAAIAPNSVDWTTDDATVALVTAGKVLAVAGGTATITARYQDRVGTVKVTVNDADYPGVKVPPVSGMGIKEATALLRKAGLSVEGIDEEAAVLTCTVRPAEVTGTKPQEGAIVSAGADVRLQVLPARNDRATVPNLMGRRLEAAKGLLVDGCLTLGKVQASRQEAQSQAQQQNQAARQTPVVVDQRPTAGTAVRIRSPVDLVLGEASGSRGGGFGTTNQEFAQRAFTAVRPTHTQADIDAAALELAKGLHRSKLILRLLDQPGAPQELSGPLIAAMVQLILCRAVDPKETEAYRAQFQKGGAGAFVRELLASREGQAKASTCLGERPAASAR